MPDHYVPDLDAAQIAEACRHTHPFWGRGRTLEEHTDRAFQQIREAGPALLRCAGWVSDTGELLCSLKGYAVQLAMPTPHGPRIVRTAGIGSVFTPEPHRGRGAATHLLRAFLEDARARGDEAALLYSDIDPGFYARLGFVEYPAPDFTAPVEALPEEGALAARPAGSEDAEQLREWYSASYPESFLRCARDAALRRFFRWKNGVAPDLILSDGPREVGYVNASPRGPVLEVEEWAAPGIDPTRIWATLRALATQSGATRLFGWLRPDQVDERFTRTSREKAIPMVADLTGTLDLAAVAPDQSHFASIDHF